MKKIYIDGELAYPIYQITFEWINKNNRKDSTNWMIMLRNELTDKEQQEKLIQYSEQLMKQYPNAKCMIGNMKFVRYETWCLQWFNHYTFDIGQTDQEVLESFERFVRRMEKMNLQNGHQINSPNYDLPNWRETYHCLMGAEDRWRWYGGDSYENRTKPPCRCEGCKQAGVIRINH